MSLRKIKVLPCNLIASRTKLNNIYRNKKYPEVNVVKFTISGFNKKIIRHEKEQENMTHNKEKNQSN